MTKRDGSIWSLKSGFNFVMKNDSIIFLLQNVKVQMSKLSKQTYVICYQQGVWQVLIYLLCSLFHCTKFHCIMVYNSFTYIPINYNSFTYIPIVVSCFTKSFAHFNLLSFICPFQYSSNIWRYIILKIEIN